MPFIGGLILGGAALIGGLAGDYMSYEGQQDTNAANEEMNRENMGAAMNRQVQAETFNADQAGIARDFSAQQVKQQEGFQDTEMQKAMDYDTQMSNTQMQRRVEDLKAAGVNPLLAVSQGGASSPTISAPSGNAASASAASIGPAGQGSGIPMQNAAASFGNLGGVMNSAAQVASTQANIDLIKAQTEKVKQEAGQEIPANVGYLKSMTGLNDTNAQVATANINRINAEIIGIDKRNDYQGMENDAMANITIPMQNQNQQILQATRDAIISAANSDAAAKALGLPALRNQSDIQNSLFGKIINYLNTALQPVGTAVGAAKGTAILPNIGYGGKLP